MLCNIIALVRSREVFNIIEMLIAHIYTTSHVEIYVSFVVHHFQVESSRS